MFLVFDTETTGLPKNYNAPISDTENWPRVIQIAWQLHDEFGGLLGHKDFIIRPEGFDIPYGSEQIHGISTEYALAVGKNLKEVLSEFQKDLEGCEYIVGHNLSFDIHVVGCEFFRLNEDTPLTQKVLDTCTEESAFLLKLKGGKGKYKFPTLGELHSFLFQETFQEAHNATADVEATARCFFELIRTERYSAKSWSPQKEYYTDFQGKNPSKIQAIGLKHINLKKESAKHKKNIDISHSEENKNIDLSDFKFGHLHNHSQFSLLQSTSHVKELVRKAIELKMDAVAITDTGNMMAAFIFEKEVNAYNRKIEAEQEIAEKEGLSFDKKKLLPIIGCEFNLCQDRFNKSIKDNGYQVVLLAKNKRGYENLVKLSSMAYTEGMYYVPRIDRELLSKYKDSLIALSGSVYGEIPQLILNVGKKQAEDALQWWWNEFGQDFYLELNRHGLEHEKMLNTQLIEFSMQFGIPLVATNNTYYVNQVDAEAHDVLLCVRDNALVETPKGKGRGFRYGLENNEYYLKSKEQMHELFEDIPSSIESIDQIINKCESYNLARDVLLPAFEIPEEFVDEQDQVDGGKRGENNYLKHLTLEGAKKRYSEITTEIKERIEFELKTIEKTGYPGYFLIVQDFCKAAREMGVSVGPGRGSAAGSVVAYATGITNVDPIKYDLLFERFLNPDRISMPDIDIDFDDEGRNKVIDYVIQKYGSNQVSQIITYGTMAAKSSIRDTARVMDLPLPEADSLAKLIGNISLRETLTMDEALLIDKLKNQELILNAKKLRSIASGNDLQAKVLTKAMEIEGSMRNTGIHACGVIITPDELTNFVPIATVRDSEMVCTQYDNSVAESAGLLKMDFLGLKTLTLIKDAVKYVKYIQNIDLVPDEFPIDDLKTFELFQRGETVGIFQYESVGMQKHLKELKPTEFADLIAMNALYRPGPMEYIPTYCKRKHGEEPIVYDLDDCEEHLSETYGITVYQEQVMLLSQKLADFTKGEADTLRKAMGKKDRKVLDKMKPSFMERASLKGHDEKVLEKIWKDWEAFASYAFNKSHSTCYAWIAYQTAYLKANYPAEYMASVLSNNMNDIKQVSFFMEECKRMGIEVLGPDVNESFYSFTVNKNGAIRFGLGAIKGVGEGPVENIVSERNTNGPFNSIFDMSKRLNLSLCNKRVFESMVYSGAVDTLGIQTRAQFFIQDAANKPFIETVMKYGQRYQETLNSQQKSIFDTIDEVSIPEPPIPFSEPWPSIYRLNKEKEMVGMFISGHPLDDYKLEIESFCTGNVGALYNLPEYRNKELFFAAIVTDVEHRLTRRGDPFGTLTIEDYGDSYRLNIFRENYLKFKHFMEIGTFVVIRGRVEVPRHRVELEFVPSSIELLSELRDKKSKKLILKLSNRQVNEELIQSLNALFSENNGYCKLEFHVTDHNESLHVVLPSRNKSVQPNNDLIRKLAKLGIEYKLS